jgi:hypothetical protein
MLQTCGLTSHFFSKNDLLNFITSFCYEYGYGYMEHYECVICYNHEDQLQIVKLPCNHIYHVPCISHWFRTKKTCPLCRTDILGIFMTSIVTDNTPSFRNLCMLFENGYLAPVITYLVVYKRYNLLKIYLLYNDSVYIDRPYNGLTPLRYALTEDRQKISKDIVNLLLQNGADPDVVDHFGITPRKLIMEYKKYTKYNLDSYSKEELNIILPKYTLRAMRKEYKIRNMVYDTSTTKKTLITNFINYVCDIRSLTLWL